MLKNILAIGSVIVVAGGLILGPTGLWSHIRAGLLGAKETVDEYSPDAHEVARIRVLLSDMDRDIEDYEQKILDIADQAAKTGTQAAAIQEELDSQKAILAKAKQFLDSSEEKFEIGGRTYTRAELTMDASARLKRSEQLAKDLQLQEDLAAQLANAEKEGRQNLAKAREVRREKANELQVLEARLTNARLIQQVADLTRELSQSPTGPDSELAKAFDSFEKRVGRLERKALNAQHGTHDPALIDWEGSTPNEASKISDQIAAFLSTKVTPVEDPTAGANVVGNAELDSASSSTSTK